MRLDQFLAVFITETQREDGTPATVEFDRYTVGMLVRYLESPATQIWRWLIYRPYACGVR